MFPWININLPLSTCYLWAWSWADHENCIPCIPDSHSHRITSNKCRINTVVSPDDGHSRPKHVEIDKYTKNKLCTKLALFTRLYKDAQSTKQKNHLLAELQQQKVQNTDQESTLQGQQPACGLQWSAMWLLVWNLEKQKRIIIAMDWPILLLLLITGKCWWRQNPKQTCKVHNNL